MLPYANIPAEKTKREEGWIRTLSFYSQHFLIHLNSSCTRITEAVTLTTAWCFLLMQVRPDVVGTKSTVLNQNEGTGVYEKHVTPLVTEQKPYR